MGVIKKAAKQAIRAFHGSPHDFDKFDYKSIGKGEGSQSFGHGLYFTETEDVARGYRNRLSPGTKLQVGGKKFNLPSEVTDKIFPEAGTGVYPLEHALQGMQGGMSLDRAIESMYEQYARPYTTRKGQLIEPTYTDAEIAALAEQLRAQNPNVVSKGKMYEVDIHADPAMLLDWDTLLKNQGPVNEIISPLIADRVQRTREAREKLLRDGGRQDLVRKQWKPLTDKQREEYAIPYEPTGQQAYDIMQVDRGAISPGQKAPEVSDDLRERGVPGIRYLDAFSRNGGGESSNYVTFSDDIVDIKRKYAMGGKVHQDYQTYAGGGMARKLIGKLTQAPRHVPGKPDTVRIPGYGEVEAAPVKEIEGAAEDYMRKVGRPGAHRLDAYEDFDEDRAARIAEAFERMQHNPGDPETKRAYDAMIQETIDQYQSLKDAGVEISFLKPGEADPYAKSPALGYVDLLENGRLKVFPTDQGFGSSDLDVSDNPLLKRVGKVGDLENATANDAFRAVHDLYGHFGPGNPFFRHKGEERAWDNHSRMYSKDALPAMTTETRGQNSWLNFGPHAEHNKTALGADTIFADQKIGLLPPWAYEGRASGGFVQAYSGGGMARRIIDKLPEKTVKAYKLFRQKNDQLYPLFVDANEPVPVGEWLPAQVGEQTAEGKVKSKLGPLAFRPGWHAGDVPVATHIGGKSRPGLKAPDYRPDEQIWAEVEMGDDVDWQTEALRRAQRNKQGEIIPRTAQIEELPIGGHYRYKTNPNMTGEWLIGGELKVNRKLSDDEVRHINELRGVADLPRLPLRTEEYATGGLVQGMADTDYRDVEPEQAMFLGRKARNAPHQFLDYVEKKIDNLHAREPSPDTRKLEERWMWQDDLAGKNRDGKMMYEIDDSNSVLKDLPQIGPLRQDFPDVFSYLEAKKAWTEAGGKTLPPGTVGDFIDHPELFEAYPELKHTRLWWDNAMDAYGTMRSDLDGNPQVLTLRQLGRSADDIHKTLLHELQHGVQAREGWTRGSNHDIGRMLVGKQDRIEQHIMDVMSAQDLLQSGKADDPAVVAKVLGHLPENEIKQVFKDALMRTPDQIEELYAQNRKARQAFSDVHGAYERNAGEIEARNVSNRHYLDYDSRRRQFWKDTEDRQGEPRIVETPEGPVLSWD